MSMRTLFLVLTIALSFGSPALVADNHIIAGKDHTITPGMRFHRFGPEQGLSSQLLTAVARDSKGFVWVATYSGLFRYDGYRFRQFVHDPADENSLSGNRIRSLLVDRDDRIWVGTESNGVTMFDPATHTFHRFGNDPQDTATYFAGQTLLIRELSDSSIAFMVFGDGMARLMPDMKTIKRYRADANNPTSLSSNHCLAADVDLRGDLWVGCFGGTIHRYDAAEENFEPLTSVKNIETNEALGHVSVLRFMADGGLWIGTDGIGLLVLESDDSQLKYHLASNDSGALKPDFITGITEDERGDVWISYRDSGITIADRALQNMRFLTYSVNNPTSISSNNTFAPTQDNEGLLWVPTFGAGLNVTSLRSGDIEIYDSLPSAPGPFASNSNIRILAELADGRVLMASRGTKPTLFHRKGTSFELDKILELVPGDNRPFWLVDALQATDGKLWLPTVGRGLFTYDLQTGSARLVKGTDGWNVVAIIQDSTGTIWLSEFARGLFRLDPSTHEFQSLNALVPDIATLGIGLVQGMQESADKALWMSSRAGVFRYLPAQQALSKISSISVTTGKDRLQSSRQVLQDSKGRMWVAGEQIAYTHEPFALEPEFIFPFEQTAFNTASATSVAEDDRGRLWFTIQDGLLGFDPATKASVLIEENAGAPTDVPEGGSVLLRDGRIAIPSTRRLTLVLPTLFEQTTQVKAPEVTRLMVGGEEVKGVFSNAPGEAELQAQVIVSPEAQDFTVEYASLTPIATKSYSYAHKLEGFNRDWIATDASRRSATYTNLAPGSYRLLMRTFDSNGRSSRTPSELLIEVLPAFYQTLWFRVLMAVTIVLLLYASYRTRIAVMKANQRKLEHQVQERTAKIESQRSELADRNVKIERTMAELKDTQGKLIQSEKLAALGGVVAGVAHEVNTPIGLVVSGASQIEDEVGKIQDKVDANKITKTDLQRFLKISADLGHLTLKNAQKAAELIKSFKRISADQTSQQLAEIELMEYLRDIVTSMKPILVETGHRVVVEGDKHLVFKSNPGTISQVVTNLITNAIEHAYKDGETGTITLSAHRDDKEIILKVADDGRGISSEDQDRVFEPFFTTSRGKGNTGLGLHIVHNMIVGALHGSIELNHTFEKGTLFVIRIPDMNKTS